MKHDFHYQAIIFDMDGTLINSDELVLKIYERLTDQFQPLIPFKTLNVNDVLALSYPEVLNLLYGSFYQHHFDAILSLHQELKHQYLMIYPGVYAMLASLKKRGYRLGLFTSEMRSIAVDELKILHIDHFFDHILAFDDVEKPKPNPDGLLQFMKVFDCKPHEIIMVGDQKSDALAAKQAGVYSILMDHERSKPSDILQLYHHVAYTTKEVETIIYRQEKLLITMPKDRDLKIIQFTDLHLMNDEKDEKTYQLMSTIIHQEKPDFIALTGDQTMSSESVMLYRQLGDFMDSHKIPYTFVFGNHDTEGSTYQLLIDAIQESSYLSFDQGPQHLGYSNFVMTLIDHEVPVGHLVFMDSHIDDYFMIEGKKTWGYGVFSPEQLAWYQLKETHPLPHLIFYHIPPCEVNETTPDDHLHQGHYGEKPSIQGINTGFFAVAKQTKQAKGMFFGHDHYNDFVYNKDGILLAYGRISGHYDYGVAGFPKGARVITFNRVGELNTYVVLHQKP